jgi:predicted amidohydrolase
LNQSTSWRPLRLAVAQGPGTPGTPSANLAWLERAARAAAGRGAGLLLCPEMFLTGYDIGAEAVRRLAEPVDGPASQAAAEIAREAGIAIAYGYPEAADDGLVYNAAQLLDRTGRRLANHRKSHLFGEFDRSAYAPGDGTPAVAELDGLKIGLLICYDVEFPENVRLLALQGVDLVLVPTALMEPYRFIAQALVPTRAYENQVFLAYANRCGQEGTLTYLGASCIAGPDGSELARAGTGEELILADLDPAALMASRRLNTYLADRRPELYAGLARGPDADGRPA